MKLNDILSIYHSDPKESRKYAKEICSNLHGTVQKNFTSRMTSLLFSIVIAFQMLSISGVFGMLLMITVTMGLVVWNMYNFSWKLTFDGATGFCSFHTMFRGTIRFHVSEIGRVHTVTLNNKGERSDCLCIPVDNIKIMVVLRKYHLRRPNSENNYQGSDTNAEKLEQYLTLYQQFLAKDAVFIPTSDDGLSPAVRDAIAKQRRLEGYIPKQIDTPAEMPSTPETRVNLEKSARPTVQLEKSAPEKVILQKKPQQVLSEISEPPKAQNSAFPDPTVTAFPDPAMKKEVDADALFNGVLSQFGKATDSPTLVKSKKGTDSEALVLSQFEKTAVPTSPKPKKDTETAPLSNGAPNQLEKSPVSSPQKSEKETDADALFNSVLVQFGKSPVPSKSKKEMEAEALFDSVLKQFGKK